MYGDVVKNSRFCPLSVLHFVFDAFQSKQENYNIHKYTKEQPIIMHIINNSSDPEYGMDIIFIILTTTLLELMADGRIQ